MTEFIGQKVITTLELIETYENAHSTIMSYENYEDIKRIQNSYRKSLDIIEIINVNMHDLIDSSTGQIIFKSKKALEMINGVYYSYNRKKCFIRPENFTVNRRFTGEITKVLRINEYIVLRGETKCNIFKIGKSRPVMTIKHNNLELPSMTYTIDNNLYCAFNPDEPLLSSDSIMVMGNIVKIKDNHITKLYKINRSTLLT